MIHQFHTPLPVKTVHGEGYAIYVESSGMFENDCWTVVLCEGGFIRHYNTTQISVIKNSTFEIYEKQESQSTPKTSRKNDRRKTKGRNR